MDELRDKPLSIGFGIKRQKYFYLNILTMVYAVCHYKVNQSSRIGICKVGLKDESKDYWTTSYLHCALQGVLLCGL